MKLIISPKRIFIYLFIVAISLVLISVIVNLLHFNGYLQTGFGSNIYTNFNVDEEHNVPSYFSSSIILFSSFLVFLCFLINYKKSKYYYGWALLSILLLFLSFDEITQVHEHFAKIMHGLGYGTSGRFYYAVWTIPYLIFGSLILILLYRFLFSIDKGTRIGYILSGFIFVMGAVGFEVLLSIVRIKSLDIIFFSIEEFLEMIGFIMFIYYTLKYLSKNHKFLSFEIEDTIQSDYNNLT